MSSRLLQELRRAVGGEVLVPGDGRYDSVRLPWNRTVDPKPAVVVEAAGPEDVRVAVLAARAHGLPFAVQATGHGTVVASDGGLLLSTARMGEVQVDPEGRTATVGPGTLWSDVLAAAAPYQLAPQSGRANSVGVAGYTLGGGGENFGVATRLGFKLYPVARVYAGTSWHPADRAAAVLAGYRDWAGTEPDELNSAVMVQQVPPLPEVPEPLRGARVLAVRAFYLGPAETAKRLLRPLLDTAGPPLLDRFGPAGFGEASQAAAGPPLPPMAVRDHLDLFETVPNSALDAMVEAAADPESPLAFAELRTGVGPWPGRRRTPARVGHPDLPFSVAAMAPDDRGHQPERVDAAMDRLVARLRPGASGGSFLNFLSDPARTETAYTAGNYRRLAGLKRVWDPDNFFHLNHNIPPG